MSASALPIALDTMGGDHAPRETVRGAIEYTREAGRGVLLVGRPEEIDRELKAAGAQGLPLQIVPARDVIDSFQALTSIRNKRDSSIHVGTRLVRDHQACAFVSAGPTAAVMAISKIVYGLIEGVDRPALPAPLPKVHGGVNVLLDAGANVDCRAEHFRQFAVMGYHYSRRLFNVAEPRVALLSIGAEDMKGNDVLKRVAPILRETRINFVGNVEGIDLFHDRADVIVCDGFVGNVALKVAEGISEALFDVMKAEVKKTLVRKLAAAMLATALREVKKKGDYAEYGGVPLLGLKQVSVVAHGRSNAKAVKNALRVGAAAAESLIVEKIARDIAALHQAEQRLAV